MHYFGTRIPHNYIISKHHHQEQSSSDVLPENTEDYMCSLNENARFRNVTLLTRTYLILTKFLLQVKNSVLEYPFHNKNKNGKEREANFGKYVIFLVVYYIFKFED